MPFIINNETENDYREIYNLVKIAFQSSKDADGDEQDYVNNLRLSPNYIPELAFTVKVGSEIIGHIMLTKTLLTRKDEELEALLLSPVCVQLEYRNKGGASELIKHSLNVAKDKGFKAVFLVGNPQYYNRFGFTSITDFGINNIGDIPLQYTMAVELVPGFLKTKGGIVSIC